MIELHITDPWLTNDTYDEGDIPGIWYGQGVQRKGISKDVGQGGENSCWKEGVHQEKEAEHCCGRDGYAQHLGVPWLHTVSGN